MKFIEIVSTGADDMPRSPVLIADCGERVIDIEEHVEESPLIVGAETGTVDHDRGNERVETQSESSIIEVENDVKDEGGGEEKEEEKIEELSEERMEGMTETQKRLFKLRMRINQGRKANRTEVKNIALNIVYARHTYTTISSHSCINLLIQCPHTFVFYRWSWSTREIMTQILRRRKGG